MEEENRHHHANMLDVTGNLAVKLGNGETGTILFQPMPPLEEEAIGEESLAFFQGRRLRRRKKYQMKRVRKDKQQQQQRRRNAQ